MNAGTMFAPESAVFRGGNLNKNKILEGALGNFIVDLSEESKRFVRNKPDFYLRSAHVLCELLSIPFNGVDAVED